MPASSTFTGISFKLQSAQSISGLTVRANFSQDPSHANPAGATDCSNPANWTLTGPSTVSVVSVNTVGSRPESLDLTINAPLDLGEWTLTLNSAVLSDDGDALSAPYFVTFTVAIKPVPSDPNKGAINDSDEDILRKHLSGALKGQGWDSLIAGLAAGDAYCRETVGNIFDQLFLATANGRFLDKRASDVGITRPQYMGMDDDAFRKYAINVTNEKLTLHAVWQLLEVFYGTDSVSANVSTDLYEPYYLNDGDTLTFMVDEETEVTVTFYSQDFDSIIQAKAAEVAAIITRECNNSLIPAYAIHYLDAETNTWRVKLYSKTLGMRSALRVIGGMANNGLQFPEKLSAIAAGNVDWVINRIDTDTISLATIDTDVSFYDLKAGDWVNIQLASLPAIDGSYEILEASCYHDGGDLVKEFIIEFTGTFTDDTYNQADVDELMFFRPVLNDIYTNANRTIQAAQYGQGNFDITIPATTETISRHAGTAMYGQQRAAISATASGPASAVTVTCTNTLSPGDTVLIQDVVTPTTVSGVTGGIDPGTHGDVGQIGVAALRKWQQTTYTDDPIYYGFSAVTGNNRESIKLIFGCLLDQSGAPNQIIQTLTPSGVVTTAYVSNAVLPGGYSAWTFLEGDSFSSNAIANQNLMVACGGVGDSIDVVDWINVDGDFFATATLSSPRAYHKAICLDDSTVIVGPGLDNTLTVTTDIDLISIPPNDIVAGTTCAKIWDLNTPRMMYGMTLLDNGKVLFTGGYDTFGTVTNSCELFDIGVAVTTNTGALRYARGMHGAVKLANGNVLVIGGLDQNGDPVMYPELYDVVKGRWTVISRRSNLPHFFGGSAGMGPALTLMDDGNVLVVSGEGTEILNTTTWSWHWVESQINGINTVGCRVHKIEAGVGASVALYCMSDISSTPKQPNFNWLVPGELSNGITDINGLHKVVGASGSSFTIACEGDGYLPSTTATVIPVTAVAGDIPGPYLVDKSGVSVIAAESVTVGDLWAGQKYDVVEVSDGSAFEDGVGYIVLGFGTTNQVGPIKYNGKRSADELMIDSSFSFTHDIPSGSSAVALSGKGAWVPSSSDVGLAYVTASAIGRVNCETALDNSIAAGVGLNVTISYPGDAGLGNSGQPTSGSNKITDAVSVWGSDEVDAEVAAARILGNE